MIIQVNDENHLHFFDHHHQCYYFHVQYHIFGSNGTYTTEGNFLMCNSPTTKNNTFADQQIGTIEISNGTLRTLTSDALFTGSFTEMLNKKLPNFQLKQSERLEIRISKECHKAAAEYRKLNGGHKKTKFNQKIRQISILKDELDEVKTSNTHTPLLSNDGLRLDNVSNSHKKNIRQSWKTML